MGTCSASWGGRGPDTTSRKPCLGPKFKNPGSGTGGFQGLESVLAFLRAGPGESAIVREKVLRAVKAGSSAASSTEDDDDDSDGADE